MCEQAQQLDVADWPPQCTIDRVSYHKVRIFVHLMTSGNEEFF